MKIWRDSWLAAGRRCRRRRRQRRPGGGCTDRCRSRAIRSSCRSSPAARRARSPTAWVRAGVMTSPLAALRMVPLVGPGAPDPRRQLRDRPRHDADPPAREDGARRRDAGRRALQRGLDLSPDPRRAGARRGAQADDRDAERRRGDGARSARPGVSPEGRFHPDTYAYSKGSTDLARAQARLSRDAATPARRPGSERAPDTPLQSADEALTLASIVEKETGVDADRGRVAGVFVNRLRLGMPLQTDPT